jgi:hypothetical protein
MKVVDMLFDTLDEALDQNVPGNRWFTRRLPDAGPTGDVELDRAVTELARIASETQAQHAWGLGDDTRLIPAAQRRVAEILADRGDKNAVHTALFLAQVANHARAGDEALAATWNALACEQGRRPPSGEPTRLGWALVRVTGWVDRPLLALQERVHPREYPTLLVVGRGRESR